MKKDGLIITRETVLGHLLFILRKLERIDEKHFFAYNIKVWKKKAKSGITYAFARR